MKKTLINYLGLEGLIIKKIAEETRFFFDDRWHDAHKDVI
jgi:hypothetical protein